MRNAVLGLVIGMLMLCPITSTAGGEHQRRFSVELALVAGDARLLLTEKEMSPVQRDWIEARLHNSVNLLPLLARYYLQESGKTDAALIESLEKLQHLFHELQPLYDHAQSLAYQYPINFHAEITQSLSEEEKSKSAEIYLQLCQRCHLVPGIEKSVVFGELGSFARSMRPDEWLARMIGGLRGDSYTSYENPFSDIQISLLFRYIRDEMP
jgi:hypothetical protein